MSTGRIENLAEFFREQKSVGTRYNISPEVPLFPAAQAAFHRSPAIFEQTLVPELVVGFSGLASLCCHPSELQILSKLSNTEIKWGLSGFGTIVLSSEIFPLEHKQELTEQEEHALVSVVLHNMIYDVFDAPKIPVSLHFPLRRIEERQIPFVLSMPCSKHVWQQTYNARSLEMTAALKLYNLHEGQLAVEPPTAGDFSINRTLN